MNPAGQLAQLGDGLAGLLGGSLEQRRQARVRPGDLAAGHAESQAQRHQPLLGAVVQITLDAPARLVAGLHDPGPGGPHLLQLGMHLGLQPGVLQRHASRGRRQPDQLRLVLESLLMDQHGLGGRRAGPGSGVTIRPGSGRAGSTGRPVVSV